MRPSREISIPRAAGGRGAAAAATGADNWPGLARVRAVELRLSAARSSGDLLGDRGTRASSRGRETIRAAARPRYRSDPIFILDIQAIVFP